MFFFSSFIIILMRIWLQRLIQVDLHLLTVTETVDQIDPFSEIWKWLF